MKERLLMDMVISRTSGLFNLYKTEKYILSLKKNSKGNYNKFYNDVKKVMKIDDEKMFKRIYWSTSIGSKNLKMLEADLEAKKRSGQLEY